MAAPTVCARLCLFCPPQPSCCALLQVFEAPPLSQLISPPVRGLARVRKPFLFRSSFPWAQVLSRFLSLSLSFFFFFFLLSYPLTWRIPHPFGSLRSSASVQSMFCENRSTCRCIFDVLVGEGELHVLLLHHLDPIPQEVFVFVY